ncbi:IclR family transcriptional regulator [Halosolutus amylolyticus]|uniref:IclR family transcriptional regulator n=1 Tax=Halosolutus amylolyticus TaxID=2932267 RepID=A0ABD5PIX5_9EURY|nr:IclR family transcriptional regulator [Halosolutus amylolyticus]
MAEKLPVESTRKTFDIIEELVKEGELSVQEITEKLDAPKTTVHGHLRSLEQLGYVINDGQKYQTSTRFIALGELTRNRMELFNVAKHKIDDLANATGEQASIVIEERFKAVTLYTSKGEKAIELEPFAGQWFPMHTIAAGKAILAHFPDEEKEKYIETHGLEQRTENTYTDREALYEEFDRIVEQGYATDAEEHKEGLSGIAVPILDGETVKGAINLFGPSSRMRVDEFEKNNSLGQELFQISNIVEVNLGYMYG